MRQPIRKADKYLRGKPDPKMTKAKFDELAADLERMKKVRPPLAAEVKRLAAMGDFSENAAYQIAKGRLRGLNQRMLDVADQLANAEIIEPNKNNSVIGLGNFVTVESAGKQKIFQILGSTETDPARGVISASSPLGAALLEKKSATRPRSNWLIKWLAIKLLNYTPALPVELVKFTGFALGAFPFVQKIAIICLPLVFDVFLDHFVGNSNGGNEIASGPKMAAPILFA
jgi:transcription elongation factor GreA